MIVQLALNFIITMLMYYLFCILCKALWSPQVVFKQCYIKMICA